MLVNSMFFIKYVRTLWNVSNEEHVQMMSIHSISTRLQQTKTNPISFLFVFQFPQHCYRERCGHFTRQHVIRRRYRWVVHVEPVYPLN